MQKDILQEILEHDSVPTVPAFALQVIELCAKQDVSLAEVGEVIQNDAATSAKILRLANSPLYGLSREVASVSQAVALLGLDTVRMLAVATALVGGLQRRSVQGFDPKEFWRSALVTSLAAHRLGEAVRAENLDQAFLGGLLQNLGVYLMCNTLGDRYLQVLQQARTRPSKLAEFERDQFGVTHAEVGAQLMQSWNFPSDLVQAVELHEDDDLDRSKGPEVELAVLLRAADAYRAVFLSPDPRQVEHLIRCCGEPLGISKEGVVEILTYVESNVSQTAQAFELDIGDPSAIAEARRTATLELVEMLLGALASQGSTGLAVARVEVDHAEVIRGQGDDAGFERWMGALEQAGHSALGPSDQLLRWGPTGFLVVHDAESDTEVKDRQSDLCAKLREVEVKTARGRFKGTVSAGAVFSPELHREKLGDVLAETERNLEQAQAAGGDRPVSTSRVAETV